jgi:predicted ABC-type transport system involved in lysophospholipase L1 biosynthesis ATPase subunit
VQPPDFETHLLAQIGVEVGERLIEQQRVALARAMVIEPEVLLLRLTNAPVGCRRT